MYENGKYHDGNYFYKSAEKQLATIKAKFTEIKQNHEYLTKRYDEVERTHQDLLHYIEFSELSANQGYKIYKKLKEIRIERRLVKSELEECQIAFELVDNYVIENFIKQIAKAQGDCKKAQLDFNKFYIPRNLELSEISKEQFENAQNKYNENLKTNVVIFK